MLDGTLDIAVLRGEYPWDGTQFLLSQEDICLIYAREYEGKPLSDYLYIDHQTDASLGAQMARWRYENGVTGDTGSFVVDNITACLEMVKRGLGWALMPEIALDNFDGCVRPCTFENGEPFLRRTYIFCQRDAAALPQVQLFMDMLKKKALRGENFHGTRSIPHPDAGCPGAPGLAPAGAAGGLWQAAGLLYHEHCGPGQGFASHPPGLCPGAAIAGTAVLRCGIKPLKIDLSKAVTGPEAFYVLDAEPLTIKKWTTLVEDASPLGRLFDMDVLRPDGKKSGPGRIAS